MNFLNSFENYCLDKKLIKPNSKIIIGLSGGADSTALLLCFKRLSTKYKFKLIAAHVNYNLRGDESIRDEKFCRELCEKQNISILVKNVVLKKKTNIESKARDIRFAFFNSILKQYKFHFIALGHHMNDQAETVLFRLSRGSAITGLKGIRPKSENVIHPFLGFKRSDIIQYLKSNNDEWITDSSNKELEYSRNKIRHELIPWLTKNSNSKTMEHIAGTAEILSEVDILLSHTAKIRQKKVSSRVSPNVLHIDDLVKIGRVYRFYIYRNLFHEISGSHNNFYYKHFFDIENLINAHGSKTLYLPDGVRVIKEYNQLKFIDKSEIETIDSKYSKEIASKKTLVKFGNFRLYLKRTQSAGFEFYKHKHPHTGYFDLEKINFPLRIRHRQPGDRFIPLGMMRFKKVKDFFIDEKVPKSERDKILIITDANDNIVWICGYRIDQRFSVSKSTDRILRIKFEEIPNSGFRSANRKK